MSRRRNPEVQWYQFNTDLGEDPDTFQQLAQFARAGGVPVSTDDKEYVDFGFDHTLVRLAADGYAYSTSEEALSAFQCMCYDFCRPRETCQLDRYRRTRGTGDEHEAFAEPAPAPTPTLAPVPAPTPPMAAPVYPTVYPPTVPEPMPASIPAPASTPTPAPSPVSAAPADSAKKKKKGTKKSTSQHNFFGSVSQCAVL